MHHQAQNGGVNYGRNNGNVHEEYKQQIKNRSNIAFYNIDNLLSPVMNKDQQIQGALEPEYVLVGGKTDKLYKQEENDTSAYRSGQLTDEREIYNFNKNHDFLGHIN